MGGAWKEKAGNGRVERKRRKNEKENGGMECMEKRERGGWKRKEGIRNRRKGGTWKE